jgi:hypothetical protein
MRSTTGRAALVVVAIAAVVFLFVVLSGDDDELGNSDTTPGVTRTTPAVQTIVVRDGEPVGGIQNLSFKKGERIRFAVQTDGGEEIHLHGYDVDKPVPAGGGKVSFDLRADLDGVFEVELHEHAGDSQIAEITVEP